MDNIEVEDWDVDDLELPRGCHEAAINDLIQRNSTFLRKAEEEKNIDIQSTQFLDSNHVSVADDAVTNKRWNNLGRTRDDNQKYSYVPSDPKKIYIKNISFRTTQRKLWEFFALFGQVRYCQLLKYPNAKSKGRGFVTYTEEAAAKQVLTLEDDLLELDGRILQVEPATWKKLTTETNEESKEGVLGEAFCCQYTLLKACYGKYNMVDGVCVKISDVGSHSQHENVVIEKCPIEILSDDLMLIIFKYLPMRERFMCERVCKKWRHLCMRQWQVMKCLSFDFLQTRFVCGFNDRLFRNLVKRDCPGLQSIDLSMVSTFLGDEALETIGRYCPSILHLNLSGMSISNSGLQKLVTKCEQLQTIKLRRCLNIGEKGLWSLLNKCHSLQVLYLDGNFKITGKCFYLAGGELQKLSLNGCIELCDVALGKLSSTCKQLKEIDLAHCRSLTSEGISNLSQCSSLEVLHLTSCDIPVVGLRLEQLTQLRELYLNDNSGVTVGFINNIGICCPELQILDISGTNVKVADIKNLSLCTQLHTLHANKLQVDEIGEHVIKEGCKLKVLQLCACRNIQYADMIHIAKFADCLEMLDIKYTDLDNSTLEIFTKLLMAEPERHLTLLIDGTSMYPDIIQIPTNLTYVGSRQSPIEFLHGYPIVDDVEYGDDLHYDDYVEEQGHIDLADAMNYLDCDDPLFEEQFEIS